MLAGDIVIAMNADSHAVLDLYIQQIGSRDALIAVHGNNLTVLDPGRHFIRPSG